MICCFNVISRTCFITLRLTKALLLCPGSQYRRLRHQQQLGGSFKCKHHFFFVSFWLPIYVFVMMSSVHSKVRRGCLEMTWEQRRQQRSFPQVCPEGMPVRSIIHPVGNTVPALGISHMVSFKSSQILSVSKIFKAFLVVLATKKKVCLNIFYVNRFVSL